MTVGCRKKRKDALPVGIEAENRSAVFITHHARENSAGAEHEPCVIDFDRIAYRAAREALIKLLSESSSCPHPNLRNPLEGLGAKIDGRT
jgi:hypothetical protein